MSADLASFLLQRIDEDEAVARATRSRKWDAVADFVEADDRDGELPNVIICDVDYQDRDIDGEPTRARAVHIARWDPAHVLAECKARRRIVQLHDDEGHECIEDFGGGPRAFPVAGSVTVHGVVIPGCQTLRLLALPYADHPDFDPSWRP